MPAEFEKMVKDFHKVFKGPEGLPPEIVISSMLTFCAPQLERIADALEALVTVARKVYPESD